MADDASEAAAVSPSTHEGAAAIMSMTASSSGADAEAQETNPTPQRSSKLMALGKKRSRMAAEAGESMSTAKDLSATECLVKVTAEFQTMKDYQGGFEGYASALKSLQPPRSALAAYVKVNPASLKEEYMTHNKELLERKGGNCLQTRCLDHLQTMSQAKGAGLFCSETGALVFQLDAGNALAAGHEICNSIHQNPSGYYELRYIYTPKSGPMSHEVIVGGFAREGYDNTLASVYQSSEQSKLLYHIAHGKPMNTFFASHPLVKNLADELGHKLRAMGMPVEKMVRWSNYNDGPSTPEDVPYYQVGYMDIMFHGNGNSVWNMHRDSEDFYQGSASKKEAFRASLSVVVQCSAGVTGVRIASAAGDKVVEYTEPGMAIALCSDLYHCTASAQQRTFKIAFFFKECPPFKAEITEDDSADGMDSQPGTSEQNLVRASEQNRPLCRKRRRGIGV
jgi:hypothetical protein